MEQEETTFDRKVLEDAVSKSLVEKKELKDSSTKSCLLCKNHFIDCYINHMCMISNEILFCDNNLTENGYKSLRDIAEECFEYKDKNIYFKTIKRLNHEREKRTKVAKSEGILL